MRVLEIKQSPSRTRMRKIPAQGIEARMKQEADGGTGTETEVRLADGRVQRRLNYALRNARYDPKAFLVAAQQELSEQLESSIAKPDDVIGYLFILSVLLDLHSWGSEILIRNSCLVIRNIHSTFDTNDHTRVREALQRLKKEGESYEPAVPADVALDILLSGSVVLRAAAHGGDDVGNDFRRGVTTWSMPYRGREGRSTRFVLYGSLGTSVQIPIGIMEVGDDAPHSPLRDDYLGLGPQVLTDIERVALGMRLKSFRQALRYDDLDYSSDDSLESLYSNLNKMRLDGKGRNGPTALMQQRKRLTYLARFVSAEAALAKLKGAEDRWISDGIRAIRDLTIPRVHMELTICGALPPFGQFLGGKLVASMAAHPLVRRLVDRPIGSITAASFQPDRLQELLPNSGLLFVTTKGLYPGHSAQYTGVRVPGDSGRSISLRKLGHTSGQTSSHISDTTMRLAVEYSAKRDASAISRSYGSGGAKRQRSLEAAVGLLGLSGSVLHAQLSRPVYGVSLVENLREMTLFGAEPEWRVAPYPTDDDGRKYEMEALDVWRSRNASRVQQRLEVALSD